MKRLVLVALCLPLGACGWFGEKEEEETSAPGGARLVGRVAAVHAEDGFALVQGFDDLRLGEGLLLTTRGEGDRAASLVVTGEQSGRYTAADLRGGALEVGDAVFARPEPASGEALEDDIEKNPASDSL